MLLSIVHSPTGLLHLAVSCLAMIFGALILFLHKGTQLHKRIGYAYTVCMILVNATAFMIYHLWGRFGIFHWFAVLSLFSLSMGMLPLFLVKNRPKALKLHVNFMYWSVIGLYGAFVSEMMTRIPEVPFYNMVGVATGGVMLVGGILFGINKAKWMKLMAAISKN